MNNGILVLTGIISIHSEFALGMGCIMDLVFFQASISIHCTKE